MAEGTTLTIRIDESLKKELEEAARTADRSVTEFVVRAIKQQLAHECMHCGRSDRPVSIGVSPAYVDFFRTLHADQNLRLVTVTAEGLEPRVYWGRLEKLRSWDIEKDGLLRLLIAADAARHHEYAATIPRGVISGWREDPKGDLYQNLIRLGYRDGNALALPPARWSARNS
jgi:hypothetical protein